MNEKNETKIIEMLKSKSMLLSVAEVEAILDEELEKEPNEMDTAIVDACIKALSSVRSHNVKKLNEDKNNDENLNINNCNDVEEVLPLGSGKKRKSTRRIIGLVALLAILFVLGCVPTIANHFHRDVSPENVDFGKDSIDVNLQNADFKSVEDTLKELYDFGFKNISLPKELLSDDYKVASEYTSDDVGVIANLKFESSTQSIKVSLFSHENSAYDFSAGKSELTNLYPCVQEINSEKVDIIVLGDDTNAFVIYNLDSIDYRIQLEMEFNSAVEFAETIDFANDGE